LLNFAVFVIGNIIKAVLGDKHSLILVAFAWPLCKYSRLIRKLFQLNPKRRRSGMDRRNLGSMDGVVWGIPAIWIPAIHAGMTE